MHEVGSRRSPYYASMRDTGLCEAARAEGSRGMSGSGLGLAIMRRAAWAHGGCVEAANAPDGGALIRVRFAP
jgi:K+-sensing histidine kinase KdpD